MREVVDLNGKQSEGGVLFQPNWNGMFPPLSLFSASNPPPFHHHPPIYPLNDDGLDTRTIQQE